MKNEVQKEKFFYMQFSERFEREGQIKALKLGEGTTGRIMHSYYMDMLAAGLAAGGTITLHGEKYGYDTPAHEIASLIDATRPEDIPLIAMTMKRCQDLDLIRFSDGTGPLQITFDLVHKYTRSLTKGTEYKKELANKRDEKKAAIEAKEDEKKALSKNDCVRIRDAWNAMAQASGLAPIVRMTDTRRKHIGARVKEFGFDQCLTAIGRVGESPFLRGENDRGWRASIDWLCGTSDAMTRVLEGKYAPKGQSVLPTPQSQAVTEDTINQTILTKGIYDMRAEAWNRERFEEVKGQLAPEMAAAIAAKMG